MLDDLLTPHTVTFLNNFRPCPDEEFLGLAPRNCEVQLRGATPSGKEISQNFGLAGRNRLGYFAPQLRPAIAQRKSRLERKLQGARVAGTKHVITLINSHVVIHAITT